MNRGTPVMAIHVAPDSGTGEPAGIEGDFKIQIVASQHRYAFSYHIADQHKASGGN